MDALFWILSGVVAGCLIGIIILWRLEARAEKQLAAQRLAEGESSASLPVIDPLAELERLETRPVPAAPPPSLITQRARRQPPTTSDAPAARPPIAGTADTRPRPSPPAPSRAERAPIVSFVPPTDPPASQLVTPPLEELPTGKLPAPALEEFPTSKLATPTLEEFPTSTLPGTRISTSALEELPTGKLPSLAAALPPPAPQPETQPTPASMPPPAARAAEAPAPRPNVQDTALEPPGQARLRLAELARERKYLEHTLEANQIKLEELQRGPVLPDSEETLAISVLQGEIARQRQRLEEIGTQEEHYRQIAAAWDEQMSEQAQPSEQRAPKAFSARRLSRPRVERSRPEPPTQEPSSPPSPT